VQGEAQGLQPLGLTCREGEDAVYGPDRQQQAGRLAPPAVPCRAWLRLAGVCAALLLGGCNSLWDDVTSRDFHFKEMFQPRPDPLEVLKESKDGDKRARAYRALGERDWSGETPENRDAVVVILANAVAHERHGWTRLEAIKTLGKFPDPRAAEALQEAYYRASDFPPETAHALRCQVLTALGQTGQPNGLNLLVRIVSEPPPSLNTSIPDQQNKLDEKIAAARALGHFEDSRGTEALLGVLQRDYPKQLLNDVGLRNAATDSLQRVTGRDFPPDATVWAEYLHASPEERDRMAGGWGQKLREILPVSFRP
jgi:HEAT repeat protein